MLNNMKNHISHGEVNLYEIDNLPKTVKRIKIDSDSFKIADSETTGNHHLVRLNDSVEIYEDKDGTVYLRNLKPTEVYCVDALRHDTIELPSSTWKITPAIEFDHLAQLERKVAD